MYNVSNANITESNVETAAGKWGGGLQFEKIQIYVLVWELKNVCLLFI